LAVVSMIADGLCQDRRHRLPSPHQPRRRRDCLGELVQIDGSEHAWFEDRGPPCTLLAFVDVVRYRIREGAPIQAGEVTVISPAPLNVRIAPRCPGGCEPHAG
jgi:hypothetical protein